MQPRPRHSNLLSRPRHKAIFCGDLQDRAALRQARVHPTILGNLCEPQDFGARRIGARREHRSPEGSTLSRHVRCAEHRWIVKIQGKGGPQMQDIVIPKHRLLLRLKHGRHHHAEGWLLMGGPTRPGIERCKRSRRSPRGAAAAVQLGRPRAAVRLKFWGSAIRPTTPSVLPEVKPMCIGAGAVARTRFCAGSCASSAASGCRWDFYSTAKGFCMDVEHQQNPWSTTPAPSDSLLPPKTNGV